MISDTYLENLTSFPDVRVVILGDLDQPRAQAQAEKYNVPEWGSSNDVLAHPDVEIVVNLTIPAAHAQGLPGDYGRQARLVEADQCRPRQWARSSNKPTRPDSCWRCA